MTLRTVIIDDEPIARQQLRAFLTPLPWVTVAGEAQDGPGAVATIDRTRPDVALLDIELPVFNGIEVLRRVRYLPRVVFTTAYDQHAVTAFELQAVDYLLKPFGAERLTAALERVRSALPTADDGSMLRTSQLQPDDPIELLFVRHAGKIVPVPVSGVVRFEARGDYVAIHTSDMRYLMSIRLRELVRRLDQRGFAHIHRSHVVNLAFVAVFEPYDEKRVCARLRTGGVVIASRAWSRQLRAQAR